MFESQSQAKRFFVEKIVAQARAENKPLSEVEQWMLLFSEADPEFMVDPVRVRQFEAVTSNNDYEAKVSDLLRRCYKHDLDSDSSAQAAYREAYAVLSQGDHYLLVMIDQAIRSGARGSPGRTGPQRLLARSGLFAFLMLPGSLAILIAGGLAWIVVSGQAQSVRGAMPFVLGALLFASFGYYLIHLWRRERSRKDAA